MDTHTDYASMVASDEELSQRWIGRLDNDEKLFNDWSHGSSLASEETQPPHAGDKDQWTGLGKRSAGETDSLSVGERRCKSQRTGYSLSQMLEAEVPAHNQASSELRAKYERYSQANILAFPSHPDGDIIQSVPLGLSDCDDFAFMEGRVAPLNLSLYKVAQPLPGACPVLARPSFAFKQPYIPHSIESMGADIVGTLFGRGWTFSPDVLLSAAAWLSDTLEDGGALEYLDGSLTLYSSSVALLMIIVTDRQVLYLQEHALLLTAACTVVATSVLRELSPPKVHKLIDACSVAGGLSPADVRVWSAWVLNRTRGEERVRNLLSCSALHFQFAVDNSTPGCLYYAIKEAESPIRNWHTYSALEVRFYPGLFRALAKLVILFAPREVYHRFIEELVVYYHQNGDEECPKLKVDAHCPDHDQVLPGWRSLKHMLPPGGMPMESLCQRLAYRLQEAAGRSDTVGMHSTVHARLAKPLWKPVNVLK